MHDILKKELLEKLQNSGRVKVLLDNDIMLYIISYKEEENVFIGTFLPCADNAVKYNLPIEKIDSIVN